MIQELSCLFHNFNFKLQEDSYIENAYRDFSRVYFLYTDFSVNDLKKRLIFFNDNGCYKHRPKTSLTKIIQYIYKKCLKTDLKK